MSTGYSPPPLHTSQEQQAIILTESSLDENELLMGDIMQRKDTEIQTNLTNALKKLKLFPIFGDMDMAKISINYFLYLEFFHMTIKIFGQIFLFNLATYLIYLCTHAFCSSEVAENLNICLNFINGAFAFLWFIRARGKEETRLLDEDMLYNFQWSEDLFSVLVEGLPKNVTKEEIKYYFNSIFATQECPIVDIIFVHNYRKYVPLKKQLALARQRLNKYQTKGKKLDKIEQLNKQISTLEPKIAKYTQEITEMRHFRGKAIVIFQTISTQAEVLNFFNPGYLKNIGIFFMRKTYQKYYLRGHRISAKQVAEPCDLFFENLHCSSFEKLIRLLIANSVSLAVLISGIFVVFVSRYFDEFVKQMVENKLFSYLFAVFITISAMILEKIYLLTQSTLIHNSALDAKLGALNYSLWISFFVYCVTQGGIGITDMDFVVKQLLRLSLFFAAKTIIIKLIEIYFTTKAVKHTSKHITSSFINSIANKMQDKLHEFDFVKGLSLAHPPLLIGAAFFCIDPQFLLPSLMIILYVYAVLDKYRLIKGSKLFISKSAKFMLRPFSVYRYIPWISFLFYIVLLPRINLETLGNFEYNLIRTVDSVALIAMVASLWWGSKPLHERIKEKFVDRNAFVTYESVCHEFSSVFRKEDPYCQTNMSQSKNS